MFSVILCSRLLCCRPLTEGVWVWSHIILGVLCNYWADSSSPLRARLPIAQAQLTMTLTSRDDLRRQQSQVLRTMQVCPEELLLTAFRVSPRSLPASAPCRPLGEPQRRDELEAHSQGSFSSSDFQEFSLYYTFFSGFSLTWLICIETSRIWVARAACLLS